MIIDLGSSSEFNIPEGSKLAKQLLEKYTFKNIERDRYTIGGIQTIVEKIGVIPLIKIGGIELKTLKRVLTFLINLGLEAHFLKTVSS